MRDSSSPTTTSGDERAVVEAIATALRAEGPRNTTSDAIAHASQDWNSGHAARVASGVSVTHEDVAARTAAASERLAAVLRDLGVPASAIPRVVSSLRAAVALECRELVDADGLARFESLARHAWQATFGERARKGGAR